MIDNLQATNPAARRRLSLLPAFLLPLLPLLVIAAPAALALRQGFNGLYGQDAYAYYDYAVGPLREALRSLHSLPPFQWPPGYPLLVALTTLLVGITPRAGQVVSLLAAGLLPFLTYLLAREIFAPRAECAERGGAWTALPLLAALLVALNGQLWQSGVVVMADTTGLAAATLGVPGIVRYAREPRAGWLALGAAALAAAFLTRLAYGLLAAPVALYLLYVLRRLPRTRALLHLLLALLIAAAILSPMLTRTLASLAAPERDYLTFAIAAEVYRWHPLTALRRVHMTADGALRYTLPNGLYYASIPFRPFYLSPLLAPFILAGLWRSWRRGPAGAWLLAGWAAIIYLFHAGAAWQNVRFTLAYLPPVAILAALGLVIAWERAGQAAGSARRAARVLLASLLVAGLLWMSRGALILTSEFIARMQETKATVEWVESQIPSESRVLAFELVLTMRHESDLEVHQLYVLTEQDLPALLSDETPTYLLLDVASVQSQWRGQAPALNYDWLRTGPGLREMGRRGAYTLFEVE